MAYIWEQADWPNIHYDAERLLAGTLTRLAAARAALLARVDATGTGDRNRLAVQAFHDDALGTASIEGETLPSDSVRSSVARRLGLDGAGASLSPALRNVEGLIEVMDDATRHHARPLTKERLFGWHAALFPTGYSHLVPIAVGAWRTEGITVQSGPPSAPVVHFEAPEPARVRDEMDAYIEWWNTPGSADSAVKAGLGHLWFETIHPFDDGNGRIGRALVDMALAAGDGVGVRYYSVSSQIFADREGYYRALEEAQRSDLDATSWLEWFLDCALKAVEAADASLEEAVLRARLRSSLASLDLLPRQLKALNKLIDHEPGGFEGGLTNAKYRAITGASKATATRDLSDLSARGFLGEGDARGRSTWYRLTLPHDA